MTGARGRDLPPPPGGDDGTHARGVGGAGDVNLPSPPGTLAYDVERLRAALRDFGRALLAAVRPPRVRRAALVAAQAERTGVHPRGSMILWRADMATPAGWVDAPWPYEPAPGQAFRFIIRGGFRPCECGGQPTHIYGAMCPPSGPSGSGA